jgi:hypothetical protein
MKHFRAPRRAAWFPAAIDAMGSGTTVPQGPVEGDQIMNASSILTNGFRAAAAALILMAATPAFAIQGDAQDMLADGGDYGVTNKSADAGTLAFQTADGGDYVVNNGQG